MKIKELYKESQYKDSSGMLFFGDCMDIMSKMDGQSVDLIVTDPPYRTITGGDSNGKNSVRPKGMLRGNRKLFQHQNNILPKDWMPELYRVLKDGCHCYIFTNALNLKDMLITAEDCGFKLHNLLVWEKNNCTPSQYYMKNCEYILFLRKGKAKWINNIGDSKTVHQFNNIIGNKVHPTEKPIDLISFYIENSSNEGDIVFEPFAGSGATCVAAKQLNRKYVGIELDEQYFNVAKERLANA